MTDLQKIVSSPIFKRYGKVFDSDEVIFRENDSGNIMYIIQTGRMQTRTMMACQMDGR